MWRRMLQTRYNINMTPVKKEHPDRRTDRDADMGGLESQSMYLMYLMCRMSRMNRMCRIRLIRFITMVRKEN